MIGGPESVGQKNGRGGRLNELKQIDQYCFIWSEMHTFAPLSSKITTRAFRDGTTLKNRKPSIPTLFRSVELGSMSSPLQTVRQLILNMNKKGVSVG